VRPVAPRLLAMRGCAELTAARIVAEVANIDRFRSEAAFARYAGLAPILHTSGAASVRLRPTRHGNRHLNAAIHRIAITQTIQPAAATAAACRLGVGGSLPGGFAAGQRTGIRCCGRNLGEFPVLDALFATANTSACRGNHLLNGFRLGLLICDDCVC
jgi:hypothetical protein